MRGRCLSCHPNPAQMRAYKTSLAGQTLHSLGYLITLVVFVIMPLIVVSVLLVASC